MIHSDSLCCRTCGARYCNSTQHTLSPCLHDHESLTDAFSLSCCIFFYLFSSTTPMPSTGTPILATSCSSRSVCAAHGWSTYCSCVDSSRHFSRTWGSTRPQVENVDAFVGGVGTGGMLVGVSRALKQAGCAARIVALEPSTSPFLTTGKVSAILK